MTEKELLFCEHYVRLRNAEAAAVAAGYAPNNARKNAWEILDRPHIQEYLNHLAEAARERVTVDVVDVIEELSAIAFTSPADFLKCGADGLWRAVDPGDLDERKKKAVRAIRFGEPDSAKRVLGVSAVGGDGVLVTYELHDKIKALALLGKHLGAFEAAATPLREENPFAEVPQQELEKIAAVMQSALGNTSS